MTNPVIKASAYIFLFLALFLYAYAQFSMYYSWAKNNAIQDFEACMVFERNRKGEDFCLNYARGDQWSPYPLYKALVLINPNNHD